MRRDDEVNVGETKILEINDEGDVLFGDSSYGFNGLPSVSYEKHCDGNHSPFFSLLHLMKLKYSGVFLM